MAGRYGLEIRGVGSADAPGLVELFAAAGRSVDSCRLAERLEAVRRQPGVVLLAAEWGPPSGLILLSWRWTLADDRPAARLEQLLVAPEHRRRGVGRLLLKAGAQAARAAGCTALELSTSGTDPSLASFCEATGFTATGVDYLRPLRKDA